MAIDWNEVKKDFEIGCSTQGLAEKYGRHERTIEKRAKKEGWKRHEAIEQEPEAEAPFCVKPEDVLDDHRSLWKDVKTRLVKGLKSSDVKAGLEELKVAKMAGEVLSNVIKGERLAWGLQGNETENTDDPDAIAREMERATVPSGTDKALDGE